MMIFVNIISDIVNKTHNVIPLFVHILVVTIDALAIIQRAERSLSCYWNFVSCIISHDVAVVYT
jgi:hypothetical protein